MNIKETIKQRIERFNKLWNKALGYSFEDEPSIMQKKYDEWEIVANNKAKELGYDNYHDYCKKLYSYYDDDYNISNMEDYNKTKNDTMDEILKNKPSNSPLYLYEISVLNEVENIVNFLYTKNENLKTAWEKYITDDNMTYSDFGKALENDGFEFSKDHSGNSFTQSLILTRIFIYEPDMFQYAHGSLANLVGDEGYYDDRSDVKEYLNSKI